MRPSQEREQDVPSNAVQPLPQDQRQTGRSQLDPGAEHQTEDLQRAGHLPRSRRHSPAGRRQQEAVDRSRRWKSGDDFDSTN